MGIPRLHTIPGRSTTMKRRAYNAYLCFLPDRAGLRRIRRLPSSSGRPALVNPPNRGASATTSALYPNSARSRIKGAPTKDQSLPKNGSLVRFVDSSTVVIQSGLTPRAPWRAVAQILRRLKRSAAGFVFNRVLIRKARPSFSRSIRELGPGPGLPRILPRNRPSAPRQHATAQELSVVTKPEPVKPPPPAVSVDASPQPAPPHQKLATPSPVTAPSAAGPEIDSPPVTRPARGRGEPHLASASRTTRAATARPRTPAPPAYPAGPAAARRSDSQPPPALEPLASIPSARPDPLSSYVPVPPPVPAPALPDAAPDDLASDLAQYPPSRLSGLRNLLVSLGRRSLNQDEEAQDASTFAIDPRFEKATVRPAYQETAASAPAAPGNSGPTRLTAQPEFLPPRPVAEIEKDKDKETVRPTPPRRDTPEGDEIQTLPSWRGQYRKKRYPPI